MNLKSEIHIVLRSIKGLSHIVFREISFVIGGILIIFIVGAMLGFNYIELWIYPPATFRSPNAKIETLKFLGYIVGGILLLWQIVLTNKRTHSTEQMAGAALANVSLIEKGQIQERFKNAIDQLGSDKEAVNLGAIYTLHHIAKESYELRKSIFDILCSYIRETTSSAEYQANQSTTIKIQSILNLLFIDVAERDIYSEFNADLHGAYLLGANLFKANLIGANLWQAKLNNAKLLEAKLIDAYLLEAKLVGSILDRATLTDAILDKANLIGASFNKTNLTGATLDRSRVGISSWITNVLKKWHCIGMEGIDRKYYVSQEEEEGERVFIIREK